MKITALSAITLASFFATSVIAAQNEISAGFSDLKDVDDNFVGISYKRYLSDVSNDRGVYLINPYLQRVSSVNVDYFTVGDINSYDVGTTWYIDDQWMMSADVGYIDYGSQYGDFDDKSADLRVGYNLNPNWQVGAGLLYQRAEAEYRYSDTEVIDEYDDNWTPSVFARYSNIQNGQGWDISTQYAFNDYDYAEVAARYFFNPGLSAALTYSYVEAPNRYADDSNVVELDVDYWVTSSFSVRLGLGTEVSGDSGLESATLLATYRF